jgi:mannose-1-phosphate guanylyltransferase
VLLEKVVINEHSYVDNSIIGWKSKIGKWVRVENFSILGEDVNIANEITLDEAIVLPNVTVKVNVKDKIIMF